SRKPVVPGGTSAGLDLDDVPGASYAVAFGLARGLVAGVEVEGIAVEGDLLDAVRPGDDAEPTGEVGTGRRLDRGGQRRPGRGADAGAGGPAAVRLVLAVVVQGQAAGAGQDGPGPGADDPQGLGPAGGGGGGVDLDDVPRSLDAIARVLARSLVPGVQVDREAVDGDLPDAARTGDHPERAGQADPRRGLDRGGQRRPGGGAAAGAGRGAAAPLVRAVVVQGQPVAVGQDHADRSGLGLQGGGHDGGGGSRRAVCGGLRGLGG